MFTDKTESCNLPTYVFLSMEWWMYTSTTVDDIDLADDAVACGNSVRILIGPPDSLVLIKYTR